MVYLDEKVIQQLIEAFNRREFEPITKLFADNVVLHYPGRNRLAGDYQGKSGLLDFWQKQIEITEHLRDDYFPGTEELSPNEMRVYPESVIIEPVNNRSSINDT